jgi:nucleoid DNA-binding protein
MSTEKENKKILVEFENGFDSEDLHVYGKLLKLKELIDEQEILKEKISEIQKTLIKNHSTCIDNFNLFDIKIDECSVSVRNFTNYTITDRFKRFIQKMMESDIQVKISTEKKIYFIKQKTKVADESSESPSFEELFGENSND